MKKYAIETHPCKVSWVGVVMRALRIVNLETLTAFACKMLM